MGDTLTKSGQDYLRFSKAALGVWFNGEAQVFIRKFEFDGRVEFEEIPNIPKYGQRVEDVGKYKRRDLKPTHNLKPQFRAIRYYLAAPDFVTIKSAIL